MRIRALPLLVSAAVAVGAVVAIATGSSESATASPASPRALVAGLGVPTESTLPPGFTKAPTVTVNGKRWRFDAIPGHYWKVIGKGGFAVGFHFQTDRPFPWAQDAPKGQLLYLMYAIPGNCADGNFAKAIRSPNASVFGPVPTGFDHWHAFVGGGSKVGTWISHIPVRTFRFAGPAGNPFEGKTITAGTPKFLPVCDIR